MQSSVARKYREKKETSNKLQSTLCRSKSALRHTCVSTGSVFCLCPPCAQGRNLFIFLKNQIFVRSHLFLSLKNLLTASLIFSPGPISQMESSRDATRACDCTSPHSWVPPIWAHIGPIRTPRMIIRANWMVWVEWPGMNCWVKARVSEPPNVTNVTSTYAHSSQGTWLR